MLNKIFKPHPSRKLFVANWKMYRPFNACYQWCKENQQNLLHLSLEHHIVICPEFSALWRIKELFDKHSLFIGAQNCADEKEGPYTGEVPVESLSNIGCTFCIVGHSERRLFETPTTLGKKIKLLLHYGIVPIVCIGESLEEKTAEQTIEILKKHMDILLEALDQSQPFTTPVCLAYEPLWAIGSDINPPMDYLDKVFAFLAYYKQHLGDRWHLSLLYGGNVSSTNVHELKNNHFIEGYLIGRGSLDFQELKKIVSLG